jgi:phage baseplate assembly protein W
MDVGKLFGRGIGFPPRLGPDGRVAWSAGDDNVRESIRIILMTRQGERLFEPDFGAGLDRWLFEPNTVTTRQVIKDRIMKSLAQWEPRIAVAAVEVEPDPADATAAIATITYKLIAIQTLERVSVTVTLGG